jgi:AcrR family transcriptional regulator
MPKVAKIAKKTAASTAFLRLEPTSTSNDLIAAAAAEFNEFGFSGTDTNRIARRAGYAPQTFYRWFKDKTQVFIAVYRAWEETEWAHLGELVARKAPSRQLVESGIEHHRSWLKFRRSLRWLSLEDPEVRKARAESRNRQIGKIQKFRGNDTLSDTDIATMLLQTERLSDALAEGELKDMGLSEEGTRGTLEAIVDKLRG